MVNNMVKEVCVMYDSGYSSLGLDDLLANDTTSYDYFHALPRDIQQKVMRRDFRTFGEMSCYVSELRRAQKGQQRSENIIIDQ